MLRSRVGCENASVLFLLTALSGENGASDEVEGKMSLCQRLPFPVATVARDGPSCIKRDFSPPSSAAGRLGISLQFPLWWFSRLHQNRKRPAGDANWLPVAVLFAWSFQGCPLHTNQYMSSLPQLESCRGGDDEASPPPPRKAQGVRPPLSQSRRHKPSGATMIHWKKP